MRWLRKIGQDLNDGHNLEVYLTILVSLALSILGIFNLVAIEIVATGILATLALLALSTINNRDQVSSLQSQIQSLLTLVEENVLGKIKAEDFFISERPKYNSELQTAKNIYIVGATLSRTVRDYLGIFEQRLKEGANIRFVIIDPKSDAVKQAALRSYGVNSDEFYPNRIKPTLDLLELLESLPDLKGKLELSLLPYMPSFGMTLIDPDEVSGKIYIEIYQHKSVEQNPTFVLNANRDEHWYKFFRHQFEVLWKSARPVITPDGTRIPLEQLDSRFVDRPSAIAFFREPTNINSYFQAANEINMCGLTLTSTLNTQLSNLRQRLKDGAKIRVLIADPDSLAFEMSGARSETGEAHYYRHRLESSFQEIGYLVNSWKRYQQEQIDSPNIGEFSVRLIPYAPSFSILGFDVKQPDGTVIVEMYQHKTPDKSPVFVLNPQRDENWYSFFVDQFERMWKDAKELKLETILNQDLISK